MATFAELYCARNACPPQAFRRRIFWRTLYWHAVPFAPLLLFGNYFAADDAMIDHCAQATGMQQIYEGIQDHPFHPEGRGWLRRRAKFRVSTRRLRRLAGGYLAKPRPAAMPANAAYHPVRAVEPGAIPAFVTRPILPVASVSGTESQIRQDASLPSPVPRSNTENNQPC